MNNNEHKVSNFEDILNLATHENVDDFMVDFGNFIKAYGTAINIIRDSFPEHKDKKNHELLQGAFTWIDDKKHDLKEITITIK